MRFDRAAVEQRLREMDARYNREHTDTVLGMLQRELFAVDGERGTVEYRFLPQKWMRNPEGAVHGGILATMFDNAMGMTASALCGGLTPTVEMQVSYLDPVTPDKPVQVRVTLRRAGRTLVRLTAELWQVDPAAPAATATGTFFGGRK